MSSTLFIFNLLVLLVKTDLLGEQSSNVVSFVEGRLLRRGRSKTFSHAEKMQECGLWLPQATIQGFLNSDEEAKQHKNFVEKHWAEAFSMKPLLGENEALLQRMKIFKSSPEKFCAQQVTNFENFLQKQYLNKDIFEVLSIENVQVCDVKNSWNLNQHKLRNIEEVHAFHAINEEMTQKVGAEMQQQLDEHLRNEQDHANMELQHLSKEAQELQKCIDNAKVAIVQLMQEKSDDAANLQKARTEFLEIQAQRYNDEDALRIDISAFDLGDEYLNELLPDVLDKMNRHRDAEKVLKAKNKQDTKILKKVLKAKNKQHQRGESYNKERIRILQKKLEDRKEVVKNHELDLQSLLKNHKEIQKLLKEHREKLNQHEKAETALELMARLWKLQPQSQGNTAEQDKKDYWLARYFQPALDSGKFTNKQWQDFCRRRESTELPAEQKYRVLHNGRTRFLLIQKEKKVAEQKQAQRMFRALEVE